MFKSEDLNNEYEAEVKRWEIKIKEKLSLDLSQLPPLIVETFEYYLKALKEYFERKADANMQFPNPYMTRRSNYTKINRKREKAHRTEQIGYEKLGLT